MAKSSTQRSVRPVLALGDREARDPAVSGRKAGSLAQLAALGLPVPPAIVITAFGCEQILTHAATSSGPVADRIRASSIPQPLLDAVEEALSSLGDVTFAVRSSSLAEDLAEASFAGQYESVIGVRGIAEVKDAILRCLASAFSERVVSYRRAASHTEASPMALLVQRLVASDAAGVAFTANPITGERDEIHVSAVRGQGERLVSGIATPDEWVIRDGEAHCRTVSENALTIDQARRVADLAARVEATLGGPQDIEWAIEGHELFLLQARPITALPERPHLDVPTYGFWMKDETHHPKPLTPFGASFYVQASADALTPALRLFGLPLESVEQRSVGGEIYSRMVPLGGKERRAPPWWLMALLMRVVPALRRCATVAEDAMRSNLPERSAKQWEDADRERLRGEVTELRRRDLVSLDDEMLIEHLRRAIDLLRRGEAAHFKLLIPYALVLHELCIVARELLGWSTAQTMELLSGVSDASSEPGRRLTELADKVAKSPSARHVLEAGGDVAELAIAAPDVAASWRAYLDDYGHRPFGYDPGEPTLAERPHLLTGLLRERLGGAWSASRVEQATRGREEALDRARSALSDRPAGERDRFERALAAAEHLYRVRDDSILYADLLPGGLAHEAAIEMGRRLASRGRLIRAEDAVFLGHDELEAALRSEAPAELHSIITRRRAERAWVALHPGPATFGRDPGRPHLRGVPTALRRVLEAMLWYQTELEARASESTTAGELHGLPGAPGRYSGPVRVIQSERDFERLRPGDVLVCPTTSPAWSVLFLRAGALVTNIGGALSHAAIIAREYGIPAVLSAGDATVRLRDGEMVTVDGALGTVLMKAGAVS